MQKAHLLSLLLFFISSTISHAQLKDVLVGAGKCEDTDYSIRSEKGLLGLYDDKKQKYVVKPSESIWQYDPNTAFAYATDLIENQRVYNLLKRDENDSPIEFYNYFSSLILLHGVQEREEAYKCYNFKFNGQVGEIGNFENNYLWSENELTKLISSAKSYHLTHYVSADSLLVLNHFAELTFGKKEGKSGVYDLKSKTWMMPAKYEFVVTYKNVYFGIYRDKENQQDIDVYKWDVDTSFIEHFDFVKSMKTATDFPAEIFENEFVFSEDGDAIIYKRKGQFGVFIPGLFGSNNATEVLLTKLSPPKHDTIFCLGQQHKFYIGKKGDTLQLYAKSDLSIADYDAYYFKESFFIFADSTLNGWDEVHLDEKSARLKAQNEFGKIFTKVPRTYSFKENQQIHTEEKTARLGFKKLAADIFYVQVNEKSKSGDPNPIPSRSNFGEDSLDASGLFVYYPTELGVYESGIYNMSLKKWLIPNIYEYILFSPQGYICAHSWLDKINSDQFEFHVYDMNFKRKFARESLKSIGDLKAKGISINP
jgi:hypothetical protein